MLIYSHSSFLPPALSNHLFNFSLYLHIGGFFNRNKSCDMTLRNNLAPQNACVYNIYQLSHVRTLRLPLIQCLASQNNAAQTLLQKLKHFWRTHRRFLGHVVYRYTISLTISKFSTKRLHQCAYLPAVYEANWFQTLPKFGSSGIFLKLLLI